MAVDQFSTGNPQSDEYQTDDPGNFPFADENPPEEEIQTPEEDE